MGYVTVLRGDQEIIWKVGVYHNPQKQKKIEYFLYQ